MNHQFTEEEEKKFEADFPFLGTDERDLDGSGTRDEVKDWIRAHDQRLLSHIREEVYKLQYPVPEKEDEEWYLAEGVNQTVKEVLALLQE